MATQAGGPTRTNHYAGPGDSPVWIAGGWSGTGESVRYVLDLAGQPVIAHTVADANAWSDTKYQVISLGGHIEITTSPNPTGGNPDGQGLVTDEYGITGLYGAQARYGWHGAAQRSNEALAGTVLMGARLYTPTLGRFLSPDPVYGGNENSYTHPNDPITLADLDGFASRSLSFLWMTTSPWLRTGINTQRRVATIAMIITMKYSKSEAKKIGEKWSLVGTTLDIAAFVPGLGWLGLGGAVAGLNGAYFRLAAAFGRGVAVKWFYTVVLVQKRTRAASCMNWGSPTRWSVLYFRPPQMVWSRWT